MTDSRPPGFRGRGDIYLANIASSLQRLLLTTQERFAYATCRLQPTVAGELAVILVEFAEDLHADIGLWRSVEAAQQPLLCTPLPCLVDPDDTPPLLAAFDRRRVQYLLWTLLPCLIEGLVLSPTHQDLQLMAEVVSQYLAEKFAPLPKDSGVKQFLATDNRFAWEIKRKLVWLGTRSYLFRLFFQQYLDANDDPKATITTIDDFVCQECTRWSGMGVIDVLAGALDLLDEDRITLQSWYERHASFYRVLTQQRSGTKTEMLTARNVVNGEPYTIRVDMLKCPFEPGTLVFGSLTPWRGEWYWSGEQQTFGHATEDHEPRVRRDVLEKSSAIAYRYCKPQAQQAFTMARENYAKFIAHFGSDLVAFPDGLALAAAEQKRLQELWDKAPPEDVAKAMTAGNLSKPRPQMSLPPNILNHEAGIGAFSDPVEGINYLLDFNHVVSGLQKQGRGLTQDEEDAIRGAVTSPVTCPAFVHRLAAEHGVESIAPAFCIRDQPAALTLEVLLHRYKGAHYRQRYPAISLVGSDV